jgi:2-desacetyl-2-hydroxyethyl bacteriochlorophyllide A dehydrogenase
MSHSRDVLFRLLTRSHNQEMMPSSAAAVEFAGPRRVGIVAVPLHEPGPEEVVVNTRFSGISGGTELLAYRGEIDPGLPLDERIESLGGTFAYPFRYGYACVGEADGGPVFAFHPHQDHFVARRDKLVPLSAGMDLRQATLFPLVETALQIALDAGPVLGDEVVVLGLGAVGALTVLLLQRGGARVVGVDPLPWRRDTAARMGIEALSPADAPGSVALVVEASGQPDALVGALDLLAHEGTALVASWYGTKVAALPLGGAFHRRRLTIRSTQVSTIPAALAGRWTLERRRAVAAGLLSELPLAVLATHTFPLAAVADAFAALDRGEEGLIHAALCYD